MKWKDFVLFAEENKDSQLLEVIDLKLSRLYTIVLLTELPEKNKLFSYNFFFEHPLSRKLSKNEFINKKHEFSVQSIQAEIDGINKDIEELLLKKKEYKTRRNYERIANIEISIMRLKQALQRLDFILTVAKQRAPVKNSARIDHWANFTAYELTNVQFVQKTTLETENSEISNVVRNISQSIKDRKTVLTQSVQTIEKTIALMNRRVLKERRIKEREKIREMFKTEFFDETSTEINEDSVRKAFELKALTKKVGRNDTLKIDSLGTDSINSSTPINKTNENEKPEEKKNDTQQNGSAINKKEEN